MWLAIGGVAALVLVVLFVLWWRSKADDPRQVADKKDPMRRFSQGIMFIITGGYDYGYSPAEAARRPLNESWEIFDGDEATRRVRDLLDTEATDPVGLAFDLVRAIHVARTSAGAEYLTQEQSWAFTAEASRKLQAAFNSFEEIGAAYLEAAAQWNREQGYDEDEDGTPSNVKWCAEFEWPEIPFKQPF